MSSLFISCRMERETKKYPKSKDSGYFGLSFIRYYEQECCL